MIYAEKPKQKEEYNFFNFEERVDDLVRRYVKYHNVVVAFDFDDTLFDYGRTSRDFSPVHDLVRKCNDLKLKVVIYTARNKSRWQEVEDYCKEIGITYVAINEDVVELDSPTSGKIYYNILLDDKAGLMEAFFILKEALRRIEEIVKKRKTQEMEINPNIIQAMLENNTVEYNKLKCIEECTELTEVLVKSMTKKPDLAPSEQSIIEEIGDLEIRLAVIKRMYGESAVNVRINQKQASLAKRMTEKEGTNRL